MVDESGSSYANVIDLTSKGQRKKRQEEVGELHEPDEPLDAVTSDELPDQVEQAMRAAGWDSLMEVQRKSLPYLIAGRDLIVQSRTGSGKTGAFLLPLFDRLDSSRKEAQALILTPTRELARQVHEEFERMKIATPETNDLEAALIYGGVSYGPQIKALKDGAQVIIGTPGRVLDHLKRKNFIAKTVRLFILDEADEMLSMGFYPDMKEIRDFLGADRQSCMFSATMPPKVRAVAREFLTNPDFLSLSSGHVSVDEISYRYYLVAPMEKDRALEQLIEMEEPESALIFANTKREVTYLRKFLSNAGYSIDEMSGDLSQRKREEAIDRLRSGELRMLVATDVAARGIDISDLSHVFIYDVPQDREYLIHRSGRTARAGKKGTTIVLATHEDEFELIRMAKAYDIEMERAELPVDPLDEAADQLRRHYSSGHNREAVQRFLPLVDRLASEHPELLAHLIDESVDIRDALSAESESADASST
ncbi:MAG: DEAD/DEAH box helicase [Longimonas sp.]|uniref:DEAD/DEAH box helicase n=1 Tax=Longimonas sp. TaxID=2039626 RepID=UPI00334AC5A6